jgi:hypothetical protein
MVDVNALARNGRRFAAIFGTAVTLTIGVGCGVSIHTQSLPGMGGNGSSGTGGQTSGSGGRSSGSGGQPSGSGGQSSGSGGQSTGSGGQTSGSGGQTTGSGGQSAGSGGQAAGSGGSTGSGGSGAGVTINGTFVPKEKAIVFIHFGHSNMRGQATVPTSLMSYFYDTQPGLWSYQTGTIFVLAKEPTAPEGTMTFAGPGTAILKMAAAQVSSSSGYNFISIGRGVGSDTTEDYLKTINGAPGALYASFITNRAMMLKGNVTWGAIVIMLGITERHLPTADQPGYPGRVQQIVSDIRADLGEPNLPVMYCDYEQNATGDLAPTGSVGVVIEPLTRMLPGLISNLVLVPTGLGPGPDGPNDNIEMQDDHHFDMLGHQVWAWRLINLMQSHGWFPWK